MLIEQAIFASAATGRTKGYQLVSNSPGLSAADVRELTNWGPSHDSLLETSGTPTSINFQRLESGHYCVSRTTQAGTEFSGRGGAGVYTQFLVVPPQVLARFANNPFALLRAANASGHLRIWEQIPEVLQPFSLSGRSAVVDLPLMAQLARDPGPAAFATLIQAALSSDRLAIASEVPMESLLAGLVSALPVECRSEFSFSSGLRFSARRMVRLSALPKDRSSWRAIARAGITLLNLNPTEQADNVCWEGWAGHVARILSAGTFSVLAGELEQARPGLASGDLDALAQTLSGKVPAEDDLELEQPEDEAPPNLRIAEIDDDPGYDARRADAPHFPPGSAATIATRPVRDPELVANLSAEQPETLDLLERLDDLVFAAIDGNAQAVRELEALWPTAAGKLDPDLIDQSREQYLRCALSICSECVRDDVKRPERAAAAIDVLCVLFEQ